MKESNWTFYAFPFTHIFYSVNSISDQNIARGNQSKENNVSGYIGVFSSHQAHIPGHRLCGGQSGCDTQGAV